MTGEEYLAYLESEIVQYDREIEVTYSQYMEETGSKITSTEYRERLYNQSFLPTQTRFLDGLRDPEYVICGLLAPNQAGKSWVHCYYLISKSHGFYFHSGDKLPTSEYDIALLLRDYDNHAQKFLIQNVFMLVPPEYVHVTRTQKGAPRIIQVTDPVTERKGKRIHVFTHDQDYDRQEGGTWDALGIDEPCPETAFVSLFRGLQKTGGKCSMTMTPLSEPWIYDKIYKRSFVNGGDKKTYFILTAFPDENLESQGGFLKDGSVEEFRDLVPEEQKEARVFGRFTHLIGRIYPEFTRERHVKPHSQVMGILDEYKDPAGNIDLPHYLVVDPHKGVRMPWAMIWAYVLPGDLLVIWDEFPREDFHKINAKHYLYDFYANEVFSRPHPRFRIMDPNAGRNRDLDLGLTTADQMARRSRAGKPLGFTTDVNDDLGEGHQMVHEFLEDDRVVVSENCQNLILQMEYYTWDDYRGKVGEGKMRKPKPKEKYKHFPDTLRYLCVAVASYKALTATAPDLPRDPLSRIYSARRRGDPKGRQYREEILNDLCPGLGMYPKRGRYCGRI